MCESASGLAASPGRDDRSRVPKENCKVCRAFDERKLHPGVVAYPLELCATLRWEMGASALRHRVMSAIVCQMVHPDAERKPKQAGAANKLQIWNAGAHDAMIDQTQRCGQGGANRVCAACRPYLPITDRPMNAEIVPAVHGKLDMGLR